MSLDDVKKKVTETAKNAADNAKQAASKIDMDKVKASAEKAKENLTADNIKAAAEKAKENLNAENLKASAEKFNAMDNKKKGMIAGGGVAALGLLFWLFSGSSGILGESFPKDASLKTQCEFTVDYEFAMMNAVVEGVPEDELRELLAQDMKATKGLNGLERKFYRTKERRSKQLSRAYKDIAEIKKEGEMKHIEKMMQKARDGRDDDVQSCVRRYAED